MDFVRLRTQNWLAMAAHLVSGIIVLAAYNYYTAVPPRAEIQSFRYQIAGPTTPDQCTSSGAPPVEPSQCSIETSFQAPKAVASWNVIYATVAFFFITAAAHFFYATDAFGSGGYSSNVAAGWNPYRWFEYGVTASLMSVIIGLVDGTRDTATLAALALITAAMQFCGFSVEASLRGFGPVSSGARDAVFGSTLAGWLLFAALWGVLIYVFATVVSDVNTLYEGQVDPEGKPVRVPAWIWFIVFMQLVYYASFGIVQAVHVSARLSDKPFSYYAIETWYIYLSFFAKLSLASGIGYGLIWRVRDCPT